MNNTAELKRNNRQDPDVYHLNADVAVLKSENKNTKERLDGIDDSLRELTKDIKEIATQITEFNASANARHRMWLFIFSLVGALTVILKFMGINI
jgi:peptidoglycan hydrolase CwlO-like protein